MKNFRHVLGLFLFILPSITFAGSAKIALILDRGGKDDKSFNASAFKGANEAKQKLGAIVKDIEPSDDSMFEAAARATAQKNFDLIIGVGFNHKEAISKIAKEFPQQKFAIVDAVVDLPNVRSLMFNEHEGSYLVGAIAAMKTKGDTIGFIGGMDIPLIRRFLMGFEQGIKETNPKLKIAANYVGVTGEAWNNPTKGKELALSQFSRGIDLIYVAAGNSNMGVFDAVDKENKMAIGVDSNQNYLKPGKIITSMVKRVDLAVYKAIEDTMSGKFTAGTTYFGLKEQGVDWTLDDFNKKLYSPQELVRINQIKKSIIEGKIKVRDYYKNPR